MEKEYSAADERVEENAFSSLHPGSGYDSATMRPLPRPLHLAILAACLSASLGLGWNAAGRLTATFDEPLHLTAGYVAWTTGDYRMNGGCCHPPLAQLWSAAALLAMPLRLDQGDPVLNRTIPARLEDQYSFADRFVHDQTVSSRDLIAAGRRSQLLVALSMILAVYLAAKHFFGPGAALVAAIFCSFCPLILFASASISNDLVFALFYFAFFYSFHRAQTSEHHEMMRWTALAGATLGLAAASKYTVVAVPVALAVTLIWQFFRRGRRFAKSLGIACLSIAPAIAVMLLVYRGGAIRVWEEGISNLGAVVQPRDSFLWGNYSKTGWWYYFLAAFALKTPIPFLIVLATAAIRGARRTLVLPAPLVLPPLVYLVVASSSNVQIGLRHVLPVFPFLFVLAAGVFARPAGRWLRLGIVGAAFWQAGEAVFVSHPYHLAYFNELAGGPNGGYRYLVDSNVDWGQGLDALAEEVKSRGVSALYISYFGSENPGRTGLRVVNIGSITQPRHEDNATAGDLAAEKRCLLAVSVTNYQQTYYGAKNVFTWLRPLESRAKLIARSILVFDLTEVPLARRNLAVLLDNLGKHDLARHERENAERAGEPVTPAPLPHRKTS